MIQMTTMTPEQLEARDAAVERVVSRYSWSTEMLSGNRINIRNRKEESIGRVNADGHVDREYSPTLGCTAVRLIEAAITGMRRGMEQPQK